MQPLGQPLQHAGDANLIHHLGELAGTDTAHAPHSAGVAAKHWLGGRERRGVATHHDRELAVLRARLATTHRRVEKPAATLRRGRRELLGEFRGRGGVIDEDGTGFQAGEHTVGRQRHAPHIGVIANAQAHDVGIGGGRGRGGGRGANVFSKPSLGAYGRAVVHAHRVAGGGQVPRHRIAHHAEADEGHLSFLAHRCTCSLLSRNGNLLEAEGWFLFLAMGRPVRSALFLRGAGPSRSPRRTGVAGVF